MSSLRCALVLSALLPSAALAQAPRWFAVGLGATTVRVAHSGPSAVPLSGIAFAGDVRLGGRVAFEGSYAEGSLSPETGTTGGRDLVEARAMGAFRAIDWFTLKAGVHLVGFVGPTVTERWTRIEARGRIDRSLIPERVTAHLEGWMALSTSTNIGTESGSGRGAEAGLTMRLGGTPMAARLSYAVDRAALGDAIGVTVEQVALSFRLRY